MRVLRLGPGLNVYEPDVTSTDFGLALEMLWFTSVFWRRRGGDSWLRWSFATLFGATGVAAALGGVTHGWFPDPGSRAGAILWRWTLLAIGVASFATWLASVRLLLPARLRPLALLAAVAAAAGYAGIVTRISQSFFVALAGYVPASVALLVGLGRLAAAGDRRAEAGVIGVLLNFVAAGLQQRRVPLVPGYVGHNALYHVVQAAALYLLFRSARDLSGALIE